MSYTLPDDLVRQTAGLTLGRIEHMSGTGASATIRVTGILKFAPDRSETNLLIWLKDQLGAYYPQIFPAFRELGEINGAFATELEYVGDATLESVLLGNATEGQYNPLEIVGRVVEIVSVFAEMPTQSPSHDGSEKAFIGEVAEALTGNIRSAGAMDIPDLVACLRSVVFVPSLCHRDLSVVNIMCSRDGRIRLIDPRHSVPGAAARAPSYGSVAIDVAAFLVSLERKELERDRLGRPRLCLADQFRTSVEARLIGKAFNAPMLDLCLAHAYSIYLACGCEYCLAPERKWLYDLMRQRFEEVIRRIA